MKIITCYKLVPEEQDISVNSDRTLALDKADLKIGQYDLNAVEAAVQLNADGSGSITGLSVGGKKLENSKARKDILSRGPDALHLVIDDQLENTLPYETARALAAAAGKLEFDLILCGEGSGDLYAQQVGLLLGEMLGLPSLNAISKITPGNGVVTVERTLENEVEVLEVPLPAVLSVSTDINTPRIPSMKAILGANKKPVTVVSCADTGCAGLPPKAAFASILAPEQMERKRIIIEGDEEEKIAAFADNLRKALN